MSVSDEQILHLRMVRADLEDIPTFELPAGYTLRRYEPGDEEAWVEIERQADRYNVITPDLFRREFGGDVEALRLRQYYLCDAAGAAVGTTTAWYGDESRGRDWGRVHWVAIVPPMQGRGLSKPLLAAACNRLRALGHERAYLSTETPRVPAICLYLKFGFLPEIGGSEDARAWRLARDRLPEGAQQIVAAALRQG